ncbi:hypothetical protein OH77DRAFT_931878 [Trametes cingulata]|nr:hypothetical protein OH77DRAFT_931878 [Trametes cingulata]
MERCNHKHRYVHLYSARRALDEGKESATKSTVTSICIAHDERLMRVVGVQLGALLRPFV